MIVNALIVVRLKSNRLKNKALLDLAGKSLVMRLYDRLSLSKDLNKVILCTSTNKEDDPLENFAIQYGIPIFRGEEMDVLKRILACADQYPCEAVVRVTGDNPLTDPELIDWMIQSLNTSTADYTRVDNVPSGTTSEVILLSALKHLLEISQDSSHTEYMTWYFTKNNYFKLNILMAPNSIDRPNYRLTVDYPEDLEVLKKIYQEFDFDEKQPTLSEIVRFLDHHPEITSLNQGIAHTVDTSHVNYRLKNI